MTTLSQLCTEFLDDSQLRLGWSLETISTYRTLLRGFTTWLAALVATEPDASHLTAERVQMYEASRKRDGRKQRTRAVDVAALKSLGAWLWERGHLAEGELNRLKKISVHVSEMPLRRFASTDQIRKLFAATRELPARHAKPLAYRGPMAGCLLALMAYAGLRRGEALAVKIDDIDLGESPQVRVVCGKGAKFRTVPLAPPAVVYLRAWLDIRPEDARQLFAYHVRRKGALVTVDCTASKMVGLMRELCQVAELDPRALSPHSFRRFAATSLLDVPGCTLLHVQRFLGHSDLNTTSQYISCEFTQVSKFVGMLSHEQPVQQPRVRVPIVPPRTEKRIAAAWRRGA